MKLPTRSGFRFVCRNRCLNRGFARSFRRQICFSFGRLLPHLVGVLRADAVFLYLVHIEILQGLRAIRSEAKSQSPDYPTRESVTSAFGSSCRKRAKTSFDSSRPLAVSLNRSPAFSSKPSAISSEITG